MTSPVDSDQCRYATSRALGGTAQALERWTRLVRCGGRLLFGDGCWDKPPTGAAMAMFGGEVLALVDIAEGDITAVCAALKAAWLLQRADA